jgi:hypothetical protein
MASGREIEVQRGRLLAVLAGVVAMLPESPVLRRAAYLAVLSILRPAESAARRLIAILAHGLVVKPGPDKAPPSVPITRKGSARSSVFPLFDPRTYPGPKAGRRSAPGGGPRMTEIGRDRHVAGVVPGGVNSEDAVAIDALLRRVAALRHALDDLPKQARRLARIFARRKAKWLRVMRPGRPPGHRDRGRREVDEILADCQWFALEALREPVPP